MAELDNDMSEVIPPEEKLEAPVESLDIIATRERHFDVQASLFDHLTDMFDEKMLIPEDLHAQILRDQSEDGSIAEFDITTLPATAVKNLKKYWPESIRIAPSIFMHSPMFGLIEKGQRPILENVVLPSRKNTTLSYSGDALTQSDLDVWMGIIYESKLKNGGAEVQIDINKFMKRVLGRAINTNWLVEVVDRLFNAKIEITTPRVVYKGRLIASMKVIDKRYIVIRLDPELNQLFHTENSTMQNSYDRKTITGDIGKWLYAYLYANSKQQWFNLNDIKNLCGSKSPDRKFRFMVRQSLEELKRYNLILDFTVDKNVVKVTRCAPKSLRPSLPGVSE